MSELFSISKIARIAGKDRRTVAARLAPIIPAKETVNSKEYSLEQLFSLIFSGGVRTNSEGLSPAEELAFWNARLKELEYKKRVGEVCEATDVSREYTVFVKGILQPFETMADRAESEGMPISWVMWIQKEIDKSRNQAAENLLIAGAEDNACESE